MDIISYGENRNITLSDRIKNFELIKMYYTPQQNDSLCIVIN